MSALSLLLLCRLLLLTVEQPPPSGEVILFLAAPEPGGLDVGSVLEAVAIYTRDLRIRVQSVPPGSGAPPPASREQVGALLRARGARLAFWCAAASDRRSVTVYSQDGLGVLRKDVVEGKGPGTADLHRAIGLKLRAILAGMLAGDEGRAAAPAAPPNDGERASRAGPVSPIANPGAPPEAKEPSPPPSANQRTPEKSTTAAPPSAVAAAAAVAPSPSEPVYPLGPGTSLAVGYGVSFAPGHTPLRHALALRGMTTLGSSIEIALGLDVAGATNDNLSEGTISLYDIPVRFAGRLVHRGPAFLAGAGLFGGVHFLSASAVSIEGQRNQTLTATSGFGLEALGRGVSVGRFSLELRGWVEGIVPRTRFLVGDRSVVQTGWWAVGVALGLTVSTR